MPDYPTAHAYRPVLPFRLAGCNGVYMLSGDGASVRERVRHHCGIVLTT
jgi:hypothetical protein